MGREIPEFYVYVLTRPSGKPFYVGKGSGKRIYHHEDEARRGCSCRKCKVIRDIWRRGGQVNRYIVFTTPNEQEAFRVETETIRMFGLGTLCNLVDSPRMFTPGKQDGQRRRQLALARRKEETARQMSERLNKLPPAGTLVWTVGEQLARRGRTVEDAVAATGTPLRIIQGMVDGTLTHLYFDHIGRLCRWLRVELNEVLRYEPAAASAVDKAA